MTYWFFCLVYTCLWKIICYIYQVSMCADLFIDLFNHMDLFLYLHQYHMVAGDKSWHLVGQVSQLLPQNVLAFNYLMINTLFPCLKYPKERIHWSLFHHLKKHNSIRNYFDREQYTMCTSGNGDSISLKEKKYWESP